MKASIIVLIALGMVAAFCAALLTASIGGAKASSRSTTPVAVLVAVRDMPAMTIVTEDAFEKTEIRPADLPTGTINQPVTILGKPLTRAVVKGQPLTKECFALNSIGADLVAKMAKGMRAVTVDLPLSSGLEGLLYPGCTVDVLATYKLERGANEEEAVSQTMLQGVEVIAIDAETVSTTAEGEGSVKIKTAEDVALRRKTRRVTLLVTPLQAQALQLATEHGTMALTMRNPLDDNQATVEPTVLNQGRLASLAEYLGSSVPKEASAGSSAKQEQSPSSVVRPTAATSRHHDITVLRGTAVEIRTLNDGDTAAATTAERL